MGPGWGGGQGAAARERFRELVTNPVRFGRACAISMNVEALLGF